MANKNCDKILVAGTGNSRDAMTKFLSCRYGALALTRAAGQAAEAERKGDQEQIALWRGVVSNLRQNTVMVGAHA